MLGILGLGNYSTLHYISRLNEEYNKIHGGYSTCPFIMKNSDFNQINNLLPNQFQKLIPLVKREIEEVYELGVSHVLVPNMTIHETIDQIDFSKEIISSLIHPLMNLDERVQNHAKEGVIVLGTLYTMNSDYISRAISTNIKSLTQKESNAIDDLRKDVYVNGVEDIHVKILSKIISQKSLYTIVLACTELSIVYSKMDKYENVIDLLEDQVQLALKFT